MTTGYRLDEDRIQMIRIKVCSLNTIEYNNNEVYFERYKDLNQHVGIENVWTQYKDWGNICLPLQCSKTVGMKKETEVIETKIEKGQK